MVACSVQRQLMHGGRGVLTCVKRTEFVGCLSFQINSAPLDTWVTWPSNSGKKKSCADTAWPFNRARLH